MAEERAALGFLSACEDLQGASLASFIDRPPLIDAAWALFALERVELMATFFAGKKLRVLALVGCAYGVLWLVTWLVGAAQVRKAVLSNIRLPDSYQDVTGSGGPAGEKQYSCSTRTLAPFAVQVDYAWRGAKPFGGGASEIYAWFFGATVRVLE